MLAKQINTKASNVTENISKQNKMKQNKSNQLKKYI